jgi:hypothetical protein
MSGSLASQDAVYVATRVNVVIDEAKTLLWHYYSIIGIIGAASLLFVLTAIYAAYRILKDIIRYAVEVQRTKSMTVTGNDINNARDDEDTGLGGRTEPASVPSGNQIMKRLIFYSSHAGRDLRLDLSKDNDDYPEVVKVETEDVDD